MGIEKGVICEQCGEHYVVSGGGGFTFHDLRCERCGEETSVTFQELGETHLRYLKGLDRPYCVASWESDKAVQREFQGEPLDEDAYHAAVEEVAGECECGGRFSLDAPPRCPSCRSTKHRDDPDAEMICFD